jgi:hypothetical protein
MISSRDCGWHEFIVHVYPFQGRNDIRLFGLPLQRICWAKLFEPGGLNST